MCAVKNSLGEELALSRLNPRYALMPRTVQCSLAARAARFLLPQIPCSRPKRPLRVEWGRQRSKAPSTHRNITNDGEYQSHRRNSRRLSREPLLSAALALIRVAL
jgi:hypothetical protein